MMMALLLGSELVDMTRDVAARASQAESGFTSLFGGRSTRDWQMAGGGRFALVDGRLESVPAADPGLFWCTIPTPPDFVLRLRWLRWRHADASGVFVRFPRPQARPHSEAACLAIERGFEVQIDEVGIAGASGIRKTGAIANQLRQRLAPRPARPAAEWNDFEITVRGQRYEVGLNGHLVTTFDNDDALRGIPGSATAPSFIGLPVYPGARVAFRNIRIKALEGGSA
ncbi:MAG: 3-keto-disaccharide hydrolase [Gemmatimonadaceae bacterium]